MVFPVVLTAADVIELRACVLALGEPLHELPDDVLGLGPEVVGGRAEDKLGSLCRLDDGELFVLPPRLLAGAVFCVVLLDAPVQHKKSAKFKSKNINPLNPNIKIQILICYPYTFSIETVGRIC